jgi:hypothetical protein
VATLIRVYLRDSSGEISPDFHSYNLSDFGGHPPEVGDLILGFAKGDDRSLG